MYSQYFQCSDCIWDLRQYCSVTSSYTPTENVSTRLEVVDAQKQTSDPTKPLTICPMYTCSLKTNSHHTQVTDTSCAGFPLAYVYTACNQHFLSPTKTYICIGIRIVDKYLNSLSTGLYHRTSYGLNQVFPPWSCQDLANIHSLPLFTPYSSWSK